MKKLGMKKVWVPVIALCSVGLIVGTGYAAWTITERQNGTATGNRKADTVSTKHISVQNVKWYRVTDNSKEEITGDPTVCFGWTQKGSDVSGNWLTNGAEEFKEDRKFTLAFDVEKDQGAGEVTPVVTRNVVDSGTAFKDCIDKNLITVKGTQGKDVFNYTFAANAGTAVKDNNTTPYTVDVIFNWGTHFEGQNPMNFYNRFANSAAWTTYIGTKEGKEYDASMYTDSSNSLGAIAQLNTSSADPKTPRFDITIDVGGSN